MDFPITETAVIVGVGMLTLGWVVTTWMRIKNGYPLKVMAGEYAFREPLVVIGEKTDPEWTAKVGEVLAAMKADGTLASLTTKWYGKDYSAD